MMTIDDAMDVLSEECATVRMRLDNAETDFKCAECCEQVSDLVTNLEEAMDALTEALKELRTAHAVITGKVAS